MRLNRMLVLALSISVASCARSSLDVVAPEAVEQLLAPLHEKLKNSKEIAEAAVLVDCGAQLGKPGSQKYVRWTYFISKGGAGLGGDPGAIDDLNVGIVTGPLPFSYQWSTSEVSQVLEQTVECGKFEFEICELQNKNGTSLLRIRRIGFW